METKDKFKKKYVFFGIAFIVMAFSSYLWYCNTEQFYRLQNNSDCSTFLINKNDTILVGHNLDDYIEVPGAIFINKRDVKKENISWTDFTCLCAKKNSIPRLQWTSKYGSVTYNTWGKEFIDGGANEQGLYIGEMTLFGTKFLETNNPKFHHHFFMQYILDNFATVAEVIENLNKIGIDGHCQWHYFIADKSGKTAVVEFINDTIKIYQGVEMPIQVLCNKAYMNELEIIPNSDSVYNAMLKSDYFKKDLRFMYASKMINEYTETGGLPIVDYCFSILKQMDMGNNKWSVVYDLKNSKIFFRTSKGQSLKYFDFKSFDFSCSTPIKVFDINTDISGDISNQFIYYSKELNEKFINNNFDQIDFGFLGNVFFKGIYKHKLNEYSNVFKCKDEIENKSN